MTARTGLSGTRSLLGICIAIFVAAAIDVTHGGPLARIDPRVAHWSYEHVTGLAHDACEAVTHLGDAPLLAVLVLGAVAWLIRRQRPFDAALLVLTSGAAAVLTAALKQAFHRDRPIYVESHGPKSFSFPSGHSSGAFAVYVLLAILLTAGLSRRARSSLIAAAVALATVVAASRVLLPVHFLSDVIAGTAIGLAVVAAAMIVRTVYSGRQSEVVSRPLPSPRG